MLNFVATTTATLSDSRIIRNRNANKSQISQNISSPAGGFGSSASAFITAAIDTTVDQVIYISGQLANTGETVTLEGYSIEVIRAT